MATFPKKNLIILAALEVPVLVGASLRMAMARPANEAEGTALTIWMVATCVLAASSISVHHLLLVPHLRKPDPLPDEARGRALTAALAMLFLAGLSCVAGPGLVTRLMGG